MDIKHGTIIGYWLVAGERRQVLAYTFGTSSVLQVVTPYGNGVAVRSRNFISEDASWFEPVTDFKTADIAKFPESISTDTFGVLPPSSFSLPTGYGWVTDSKGDKYIVPTELITDDGQDSGTGSGTGGVVTNTGTRAVDPFTDPIGWVKANPIWAAGIVFLVYLLFFQKKGKKKRVLGIF